ncbi:MAG: polysaccharide deacetylase family protein [Spirochaetaceae bacterium]|nr:polysaccharide deacetylase family protein [Spirochaetaceae bacterium]
MKSNAPFVKLFTLLLLLSIPFNAGAEMTFGGINVFSPNEAIFTATGNLPGETRVNSYTTLFKADLDTRFLYQLTFFPERVLFLREQGVIQISNRFGVFRSDKTLRRFQPVLEFPSFVNGSQIYTGKISGIKASPDGRWLVYMVRTSSAFGSLVLMDLLNNNTETIISSNVEYSYREPRVLWADNSRLLVYEKAGSLFYFSLEQKFSGILIAENFRRIGQGRINNAAWTGDSLLFLKDNFIFRIKSSEIYEATLYSDFIDIGEVIGRIPFKFDPNFDNYWVSPNGLELIINKGGRNIFYCRLDRDTVFDLIDVKSLPYIFLPRNTVIKNLVWGNNGVVTVLTSTIVRGKEETALFRLYTNGRELSFERLDESGVFDIFPSDDLTKLALVKNNSVAIVRHQTWQLIKEYRVNTPLSVIWLNNDKIAVFGKKIAEVIKTGTDERDILTISQVDTAGFNRASSIIICSVDGRFFEWDGNGGWNETTAIREFNTPVTASNNYRLFVESLQDGSYRNMVYVRDIRQYTTVPLFPVPRIQFDPIPLVDEPVNFRNFSHGSRVRGRYVSLVFNAVRDDSGLTEVLNVLSDYGIRATFFLSGDFIRRHPAAVTEIADSGHEVGSLFYYNFDLTDARFGATREFIRRGLARNEHEYFRATGRELSLIWQAPFHFVNSIMIEAAEQMNYRHIGRDVIILDSKSSRDPNFETSHFYESAANLVETIIAEKRPGSIIPVAIGKPDGGRGDYLFQYLEVLINNLIALGYEIVPVSAQINMAR